MATLSTWRALTVSALMALTGCGVLAPGPRDAGTGPDGGSTPTADGGSNTASDAGTRADGGSTGSLPTQATYCASEAAATCARYVACQLVSASGEGSCRAMLEEGCTGLQVEVAAGRRRFSAEAGAACLGQLAADACSEIGSACSPAEVFPGAVANGGACKRSSDCVAGTCEGLTETTCGSCAPFGALGAACGVDGGVTCARDAYCASNACAAKLADGAPCATRRACSSGVCNYDSYLLEVPDAGRTCGTHPAGAACADLGDCDDGLWCAGYAYDVDTYDTLRDGVCSQRPAVGTVALDGTCGGDGDCASGLWCDIPDGYSDGRCAPRGGNGAPCSQFLAYFSGGYARECLPGYTCGEGGCAKMGEAGEACADTSGCKYTLDCPQPLDGGTPPANAPAYGVCAVPVALGGSCYGDGVQCAQGAFCDPGTFTCLALLANDAACTANGQCASGTCGSSGACAAPLTCQ